MKIQLFIWFAAICILPACSTVSEKKLEFNVSQETITDFKDLTSDSASKGNQLVVTTISGGGHRAANFGLGHLLALDTIQHSENKTLLDEVDVISSVSGGGVGVSVYISAALDWINCNPNVDLNRRPKIYELLLNNPDKIKLLRKQWGTSVLLSLHPKAFLSDRTRTDLFNDNYYKKLLSKDTSNSDDCASGFKGKQYTLRDINKYGALEDGIPVHIPNATLSTKGLTFPYVPKMLELFGINCIANTSGSWAGAWDYIPDTEDFPYSLGLLASAAFPPMLPDVRLGRPADTRQAVHSNRCDPNDIGYIHLTDGGQSDDNGYFTGIKVLLNELVSNSDKEETQSPFLMTVDSLTSDGHYWSKGRAENFLYVLLLRNADLPRHGPKRLIGQELESLAESFPSRLNELPKNSSVYAAHIKMTNPYFNKSTTETFKTASGLSLVEQQESMAEGLMQTYKSLFGLNDTGDENSCLKEDKIKPMARDVSGKIVCRSYQLGNKLYGAAEQSIDNDQFCAVYDAISDPMRVLKKHIRENTENCSESKVTAFEKTKDDADWTESLLSTSNAMALYRNNVNQLVVSIKNDIDSQANSVYSTIRINEESYRSDQLKKITKLIADQYSALAKKEFEHTEKELLEINERLNRTQQLAEQKKAIYDDIHELSSEYIEPLDSYLKEGNQIDSLICADDAGTCVFTLSDIEYEFSNFPQREDGQELTDTVKVVDWLDDYKKYFDLEEIDTPSFIDIILTKLGTFAPVFQVGFDKVRNLRALFDKKDNEASGEFLLAQPSIGESIKQARSTIFDICDSGIRKRYAGSSALSISITIPIHINAKIKQLAAKSREMEQLCSQENSLRISTASSQRDQGITAAEKLLAYKELGNSIGSMQKRISTVQLQYKKLRETVAAKYDYLNNFYNIYNSIFSNTPVNDYEIAVSDIANVHGIDSQNVKLFTTDKVPQIDHNAICGNIVNNARTMADSRNISLYAGFEDLCFKRKEELDLMCQDINGRGESKLFVSSVNRHLKKFNKYLNSSQKTNNTSANGQPENALSSDDIIKKGMQINDKLASFKFSVDSESDQLFCSFHNELVEKVKKGNLQTRKHATFVRRKEPLNSECIFESGAC